LNLDLAKTYIQLGAYDAAREILLEGDADYTSTQREVAEQLLNQIAS
jgi:FimV-like protein